MAEEPKSCTTAWDRWKGPVRRCTRSLRYTIPDEELAAVEAHLEETLVDELRYDMKVALVALPDGGYNFVLHNRRGREEVRGLCDPSFVAFNLAGYTAGTDWKSVNLHVWLAPYEEGWGLPTRGSRTAVAVGRSKSYLGAWGVVEIRAFRTWLDKAFYPLPAGASRVAEPAGLGIAIRDP